MICEGPGQRALLLSAGLIGKPVQVRHGPATVKQGLFHMPLSL